MAQAFNRAMEMMGWRVPEDEVDDVEPDFEFEADVKEIQLQAFPGGKDETFASFVPAPSLRRIVTVHPTSYADARAIGEAFRDGLPVIMNLSDLQESEARRVIDFAAGLVFGLHGVIEKVTARVFLLSPRDVEVSTQSHGAATSLFQ